MRLRLDGLGFSHYYYAFMFSFVLIDHAIKNPLWIPNRIFAGAAVGKLLAHVEY